MIKVVLSYVSIFCLLILVSANTITTSLEKKVANTISIDWSEEGSAEEETTPTPIEEDTSGQDDETSKLVSLYRINTTIRASQNRIFSSHFLTSFHFLEIISPPPQGC